MGAERVVEGSEAIAQAVAACRPQVISAFPISPQTHIVESLARMVADGDLPAEYVCAESEFSAASILAGASAAGSRSYTASSSQGLLLMTEVFYASAGLRLPFVITGVNRAVSAPISIQVDNQDTVSLRDAGVLQFYAESCQEAYDLHIAAFRIAEDPSVLLPVMVCLDGWVLTHSYERVRFALQEQVDAYLPPFRPRDRLDGDDPKTWGSYAEEDVLMELRYAVHHAMVQARPVIRQAFTDWAAVTGRDHGGLIEAYRTDDAQLVLVAMGSVTGTIKEAVDDLRRAGRKIGLVKVRCYRPFPLSEIQAALAGAKAAAVLDANISMGSRGALALDLKAALHRVTGSPMVVDFVAGLGGRAVGLESIERIIVLTEEALHRGSPPSEPIWLDLNSAILPEEEQP